jgi:hypothetical protein
MWKRILQFLPSIGLFVIGGGLQLSGVEIPWLGFSLIGLGGLLLIIPLYSWLKNRKRYGVAELASDMATMSAGLAAFVAERQRYDPTYRIKALNPNWDDNRKHEQWQEHTQEVMGYSSATVDIYRQRFASKVIHLVEEAQKLGYQDKELTSMYQHPVNTLTIGMLSDRMGALSLRIKRDIK